MCCIHYYFDHIVRRIVLCYAFLFLFNGGNGQEMLAHSATHFNPNEWDSISHVNIDSYLNKNLTREDRYYHITAVLDSIKDENRFLEIDTIIGLVKQDQVVDSFLVRKTYTLYGWFLNSKGFKNQAINAYRTAHDYAGRLAVHNNIMSVENSLGILFNERGDHLQSKYYYKQAIAGLNERLEHVDDTKLRNYVQSDLNRVQNNYGWLLHWMGDHDQAMRILETSFNLSKKTKNAKRTQFFAAFYLTKIFLQLNDKDKARHYLSQLDYKNIQYKPSNKSLLASVMVLNGQLAENEAKMELYFKAAADSIERWSLSDRAREIAKIKFHVATSYFSRKNWNKGLTNIHQGLALLKLPTKLQEINYSHLYEENTVAQFLTLWSEYYQHQFYQSQNPNFADSALNAIEFAQDVYSMISNNFLSSSDQLALQQADRALTNRAIDILWHLNEYESHTDETNKHVNRYFNKSKNTILTQARQRQQHFKQLPPTIQQQIQDLKTNIANNTAALHANQSTFKSDSIFENIYHDRTSLNRLLKETASDSLINFPNNAIEFLVADAAVYVRYSKNDNIKFARVGERHDIDSMLALSSMGIAQKDTSFSFFRNQYNLYQRLILPYQPNSKSLTIIPDDAFQLCAFNALVCDLEKKSYLIEKYNIGIGYDYDENTSKIQYQDLEISTITPQYDLPPAIASLERSGYYQLLFTDQEIEGIKNNWRRSIQSIDATHKSKILNALRSPGIFHFAGHATAQGGQVKLLLASDERQIITGEEIMEFPSAKTLAVLSACETGMGKLAKGDGVRSLAKSFLESGVSHVVYTIWPINDQTSAKVVADFYQFLSKSNSPTYALNEAQRTFLARSSDQHKHPYYWAAYQATADQQSHNERPKGSRWLTVFALICVIPILYFKMLKK